MNFIDKAMRDSKLSVLVVFAVAIIGLILLLVYTGLSWWFWLSLILWICFYLLFFAKLISLFKITQISYWLSFIILLIVTVIFIVIGNGSGSSFSGNKAGSSDKPRVACTSDGSDSPVSIDGWKVSLYSQEINSGLETDSGIRSFSISSLKARTGQDIFYRLQKPDGSVVAGAKGVLEVCDSENKTDKYSTTKDTSTKPASNDAVSVTFYLNGNNRVKTPGNYRVDAYANVDGSWKLVARDNIIITE